jgi:hypothetical protein
MYCDVMVDQGDFGDLCRTVEGLALARFTSAGEGRRDLLAADIKGIFRFTLVKRLALLPALMPVIIGMAVAILLIPLAVSAAGLPGPGALLAIVLLLGLIASVFRIAGAARGRSHVMTIDDSYLVLVDTENGEERLRVPRGHLVVERLRYVGGNGDAVRISGPSMPAFTIGCNTGREGVGTRVRGVDYAFNLSDWDRLRRALAF